MVQIFNAKTVADCQATCLMGGSGEILSPSLGFSDVWKTSLIGPYESAAVPSLNAGFAGRSRFARGVFTASAVIGAWQLLLDSHHLRGSTSKKKMITFESKHRELDLPDAERSLLIWEREGFFGAG